VLEGEHLRADDPRGFADLRQSIRKMTLFALDLRALGVVAVHRA
jgi:hypothetical protein